MRNYFDVLRALDKAGSRADPEDWVGVERINQTIVLIQHRNRVDRMDSPPKLWLVGLGARLRWPVANVQICTRFHC